ncbi:MAG TPA: alkaline phosphatase family protein [Ktedonobacteraceae bacterium]|nr:alkaline phosphatase family protein [Ktedonobacteraceae bacterium]
MKKLFVSVVTAFTFVLLLLTPSLAAQKAPATPGSGTPQAFKTTTPIKHLVVIFQENVSFDHYFGTYPYATNPGGEPKFTARPNTPAVNGLTPTLLTHNPNSANPFRLDRSQALTCDQDHGYTAEQEAFDHGLMDKFVQDTSGHGCTGTTPTDSPQTVMGYFDGNTVTALWNYAQNFAMSDNSYGTTFGPSTPGALNLISGQTHGATPASVSGSIDNGTIFNDLDPLYDDCSAAPTSQYPNVAMSGTNIGDLLNAKHITWGWFEGGFAPTSTVNGKAVCGSSHTNIGGATVTDYIPHHEPFQYYQSTANPHHLPPTSTAMIGYTDQANHQYDISDFWAAADAGNLPAVSFLKAPAYQDGHAGYSDPLDEQHFLVDTINQIESLPTWNSTAIIIAYDDSDGWYDHVMGPIVSQSNDPNADALTDPGMCGTAAAGAYETRCGYGPRLPMLVISPYARANFVDNTVTDQSSILRFIEDNWQTGRIGNQSFDALAGTLDNMFDFSSPHFQKLFLDPVTGEPVAHP